MANENGMTGYPQQVSPTEAATDYLHDLIPAFALQSLEVITDYRLRLQAFMERLQKLPPLESIDKTPDGKASTILISHIEMTLDEMFFGLWESYEFKWSVIANEVVGSIILEVVHPVNGMRLRRTGAAAIQIMVDQTPADLMPNRNDTPEQATDRKRRKNAWANDPNNKKPAALDMGFPKLKAECMKNAAQSLGKSFGRDLNRGAKADTYKPLQRKAAAATESTLKQLNNGKV